MAEWRISAPSIGEYHENPNLFCQSQAFPCVILTERGFKILSHIFRISIVAPRRMYMCATRVSRKSQVSNLLCTSHDESVECHYLQLRFFDFTMVDIGSRPLRWTFGRDWHHNLVDSSLNSNQLFTLPSSHKMTSKTRQQKPLSSKTPTPRVPKTTQQKLEATNRRLSLYRNCMEEAREIAMGLPENHDMYSLATMTFYEAEAKVSELEEKETSLENDIECEEIRAQLDDITDMLLSEDEEENDEN